MDGWIINFDDEKNQLLKASRGICFEKDIKKHELFLKTVYPSRKFTKLYKNKKGGKNEK